MANLKTHAEDCKRHIGDEMWEVHKFFDQHAEVFPIQVFYDYHRTFLHNSYGLTIVCNRWGEKGRIAGTLHLVRDWWEGPFVRGKKNWTYEEIESKLPKVLVWFNKLRSTYEPMPFMIKAWNNTGLVAISQE